MSEDVPQNSTLMRRVMAWYRLRTALTVAGVMRRLASNCRNNRFSSPIAFSPPASSRWRAEYLRNAHPYRFRQCSLIFETRTSRHLSWCEDKLLEAAKSLDVNFGDHDTSSPMSRARGSARSSLAAMRSCSSTGGTGTGSDSALVELSPSFVPPFWRCIICRNPKSEVITV